jgi:TPR repeat protein
VRPLIPAKREISHHRVVVLNSQDITTGRAIEGVTVDIVRSALLWAIFALVASTQSSSAAETRLALIIANAAYSGQVLSRLDDAYKDGEILSEALRKVGFDVLVVRDANQQAMRGALNDFARRLRRAGADAIGFFYYSGHGAALAERGENYLIPTGAEIEETSQLSFNAVGLTEVVHSIEGASPKAAFVVIDACRDIAFRGVRGVGPKGFVVQSNTEGMIIGFATRPGETALDSNVYSTALATSITTPGLDASAAFKDAQRKVAGLTANKQIPWIEDGLLSDFRFVSAPPDLSAPLTGSIAGSAANDPGVSKDDVEAVRQYRKAADAGNFVAMNDLGYMYGTGRGVAKDYTEAVRWYRKAADAGSVAAMDNLGVMYRDGLGVAKDDTEAVRWYRKAANAGHAGAMNNLGNLYETGRGVAKDDTEALRWYRKAADGGNSLALSNVGFMYENGEGVAKDEAEAVRWYRKAANAGDLRGMTNLGLMYENGRGVTKDETEAIRLYRKAADGSYPRAMNQLGLMYENGRGVAKDDSEAVRLFRKAADAGGAGASFNLGFMYQYGRGIAADYTEAARWYRKAADAGLPGAMNNLGVMYRDGLGVAQDDTEAVRWYRKAADAGGAAAMNNLGFMYQNGRGVKQDRTEARIWYEKAAAAGNSYAKDNLRELDQQDAKGR